MTKFFFKFKKPIFGPFPNFWGKISFSKNRTVMHNFIRVSFFFLIGIHSMQGLTALQEKEVHKKVAAYRKSV